MTSARVSNVLLSPTINCSLTSELCCLKIGSASRSSIAFALNSPFVLSFFLLKVSNFFLTLSNIFIARVTPLVFPSAVTLLNSGGISVNRSITLTFNASFISEVLNPLPLRTRRMAASEKLLSRPTLTTSLMEASCGVVIN